MKDRVQASSGAYVIVNSKSKYREIVSHSDGCSKNDPGLFYFIFFHINIYFLILPRRRCRQGAQ